MASSKGMPSRSGLEAWSDPRWRAEAVSWADEMMAQDGRRRLGPAEQPHLRPWSTVLRLPAEPNDLYLKATAAALKYEARLTLSLAERTPALVPTVVAVDVDRGWLLLEQGGRKLREVIQSGAGIEHWRQLLPRYGRLQREWEGRTEELLSLGLPDRRPERLPTTLTELLADETVLRVGQEGGLQEAEATALEDAVGPLTEACRQLANTGVRATLDHGDFHDGNIFLRDGEYVFFDWGDASLGHPFFSLRTAFVSIENTFGLAEGDPAFDHLRDHYLQAWQPAYAQDRLRRTFALASRFWSLSAASRWRLALANSRPSEWVEYQQAIPSLLREFLRAFPVD